MKKGLIILIAAVVLIFAVAVTCTATVQTVHKLVEHRTGVCGPRMEGHTVDGVEEALRGLVLYLRECLPIFAGLTVDVPGSL